MANVVNLDDHRPHTAQYVACMDCAHDWVAVAPKAVGKLECPSCGSMSGEPVSIHDKTWFNRFMSGKDQTKRTLVCLNANRMGI